MPAPHLRALTASLAAATVLAGCGGGGGSGSPPVPTPTPTPTPAPSTCTASVASFGRLPARTLGNAIAPNQLYVTYRTTGARGAQSLANAAGVARAVDLGEGGGIARRAVYLDAGTDAATAAARLRANPDVIDVAPVHLRSLATVSSPNDPYFENVDQWYTFRTNVSPGAWSLTQGGNVAIAIIDTGADETNADFQKFDVRESVVNGVVRTGAGTVQDTNGHGTNVTGLAAASANNGYGFAGVGYNAHLQIYKVFPDATAASDCQTASTADEARAINDAVANGASVINLSLGAPPGSVDAAEQQAVEAAISAGVTVVAAGGNDTGASPDLPGGYPGVISVGASTAIDTTANSYASITGEGIASYSNSGVTLVAPGGDPNGTTDNDALHWIEGYSTTTAAFAADRCSNTGGVCRAFFAGTSQATPQVAGTAALMMAYHGGARSLSPATVASLLAAHADNIGAQPSRQGAGRLNAGNAVAAAHP